MKNEKTALTLVLITAAALLMTACFGGGKGINSAAELKEYLDSQPANSPDKPIRVRMSLNEPMFESVRDVLKTTPGKYVHIDLSGSPLTAIPDYAFYPDLDLGRTTHRLYTLSGITIPNSITYIGEGSFTQCVNLNSVTFLGTIAPQRFHPRSFPANLREEYLNNGVGTYTAERADIGWKKWKKK